MERSEDTGGHICVVIDLAGLAESRGLEARDHAFDVLADWIVAYPTDSTFFRGDTVVGEARNLGTNLAKQYWFKDADMADAFRDAFAEHIIDDETWVSWDSGNKE